MLNRVHNPARTVLMLLATVLILGGCATGGLPGASGENRAERLARAGRHDDAAAEYINMAGSVEGPARERLTLLAIDQWLEAGDVRRARNAMRRMEAPQSGERLWLWSSNAAALALWDGRPDDALRLIEPLLRQPLDDALRLNVEALQADAWFQKGDPIRAIALYQQRELQLGNSRDILQNRQRLWAGLLVSHPRVLRAATEMTDDPEILGWLTLGALATSTGQQGVGWSNGAQRWLEQYANHPAAELLAELDLPPAGELGYPQQVALLLPLSGSNKVAGEAVQNGFFGAYFAASDQFDNTQQVRVYDSNGGIRASYRQAVSDGAQFVVGPLLRGNVSELAAEPLLPVPVLALNYLPDNAMAPPALYQFALSPEDEAVAAAERAIADGHRQALVLVPRSDWGRRLATSFADAMFARGGNVLEMREYEPEKQDFSFEIENLMLLTDSVQRYQRLRANIGGPLQYDPRRRQDADFIFLAATAQQGRLLKSQLKFHYAGDLPVYSTSRIFAMDGRSNSDLNGVLFADTPWIVAPQPWLSELVTNYAESFPAQRNLGRLQALGYDAYQLIANLYSARLESMPEIDGATGRLYLDENGRIHRKLAFARFENGVPVAAPLDDQRRLPTDEEYPELAEPRQSGETSGR